VNQERARPHDDETEDAAFRTDRTSGEPGGALQCGVRKMALEYVTAVGHRKKKRFTEIESRMPSDYEPEIAGAFEG